MENLVGIIVGFALTTLVGGWWAAKLQERSWARQNDVRLRESANERAGTACQELMSLLDRRLYRMQRLLWAATASGESDGQNLELERRREEYADVLFAWNDRLNTNLSLTGSFFGDEARAYLDQLYEDFKRRVWAETLKRSCVPPDREATPHDKQAAWPPSWKAGKLDPSTIASTSSV